MDQIVNQAAKIHYMFGGKAKIPLVLRTNIGAGRGAAAQHSQSLHAWFVHAPGLKVVLPSSPYDVKGLLVTAIEDNNPVMFIEHKMLYYSEGEVPEELYSIPFGKGEVKREGKDLTVVALSSMVGKALRAAEILAKDGVDIEVVDPRTLVPLDEAIILDSVKKTGRLLVVDEGHKRCGIGAEIAAIVSEKAFDYLDAPILRLGSPDVPVPFSHPLEKAYIPDEEDVKKACHELITK
jgi:pyruvate dehydrogenase E1 component beta subunit